ncbi:SAM-dependent methyltransferase [Constrictibacter sp. MBR-5]|uniref:class I SAM-dependent methyltransferase n=1 Tax=Constrictibacter sp. MBR-5 TaxID=3156467 RepID=UPI00339B225F
MSERGLAEETEALPSAYAAWRGSTLGRITDEIERDLMLSLLGPLPGCSVLDAGCGDGQLALELAGRGARVVGVDASQRMIAAARRRAAGRPDVSFHVARAEDLPFRAAEFDIALAVTMLCFVEDASVALKEMVRVVKPGGRLVVGDLGRYSSWAAVRRIRGWLGSPVWRHARFRSAPELERLARREGLTDVSVRGAVFFPPVGLAARLLGPADRRLTGRMTVGAAFLVLTGTKPSDAPAAVRSHDHHFSRRGPP